MTMSNYACTSSKEQSPSRTATSGIGSSDNLFPPGNLEGYFPVRAMEFGNITEQLAKKNGMQLMHSAHAHIRAH